jgi:hypothetical protein
MSWPSPAGKTIAQDIEQALTSVTGTVALVRSHQLSFSGGARLRYLPSSVTMSRSVVHRSRKETRWACSTPIGVRSQNRQHDH